MGTLKPARAQRSTPRPIPRIGAPRPSSILNIGIHFNVPASSETDPLEPGCLRRGTYSLLAQRALRFPAAAQRAVKCHGVEQAGGLDLQEILLCGVKILLREENVHIVVNALTIARVSEVETFLLDPPHT